MNSRIIFLIEKSGHQVDNFYEAIANDIEITINNIKRRPIAPSSFYCILKKDINKLNTSLEELNIEKAFEYSYIRKDNRNLITIKRNSNFKIKSLTYHYILELERKDYSNGK